MSGIRDGKAAFWDFVIREKADSGLGVREFCKREGVSEPSFYQWRKKLEQVGQAVPAQPTTFLRVKLVTASGSVTGTSANAHLPVTNAHPPQVNACGPVEGLESGLPSVWIVAPGGWQIHVASTATSGLILQALVAFEELARRSRSC